MFAAPSLLLFSTLVGMAASNLIKSSLDNPHCGAVPEAASIQRRMIIGGSEAQPKAWPWQIAVLYNEDRTKKPICGGTLISSELVLTAAHCVVFPGTKTMRNLSIIAGDYNLADRDSEDRQERLVARAFVHPKYKDLFDNDIALLKLDQLLRLTTKVWPACLPSQGEELKPQTTATILGWGATYFRRNPENREPTKKGDLMLREAPIPVVNLDDCKQGLRFPGVRFYMTHNMVCAGYMEGQRIGACKGDSGGPLLVERDNRWYVHGVAAFGDDCGEEDGYPIYSIYSKTSSYINWINQTVSKLSTSRNGT